MQTALYTLPICKGRLASPVHKYAHKFVLLNRRKEDMIMLFQTCVFANEE